MESSIIMNRAPRDAAMPPVAAREAGEPCNFRKRGLTLATFVVALAGFAGTAFSAVPAEIFGQPGACIVSR